MVYLHIQHKVADYGKWRPGFDANAPARKAGGSTGEEYVYRSLNDPNEITVIMGWSDADKALKFSRDPALKEAMKDAGVLSQPEVKMLTRN
jgi:quinol monooxygenase YgiN